MSGHDFNEIVPTRAMLQKGVKPTDFKVTVFETQRKSTENVHQPRERDNTELLRTREKDNNSKSRNGAPSDATEFDMKRARHEVINFGLNGFESKDKKRAQIALAVKLGAKAPKAEYSNYKDLLATRKRLQAEKDSEKSLLQLGKNQMGVANVRCHPKNSTLRKRKRKLGEISSNYGVVKPQTFKKKKRRN